MLNKTNKKYRSWIINFVLFILIFTVIRVWTQRDVISGVAPNIAAPTLDENYFELYQNQKRPLLLHFWASWCPVCNLEQSSIESIAATYPVMTVAMQSGNNDELKTFMQKEGLTFNVINDELGMLSKSYGIRGVPASFIINKDNIIEFVEVGYTSELGLRLRLWWAGL